MNVGRTVFSQLMDLFPLPEFRRLVAQHGGEHRSTPFPVWTSFYAWHSRN